MFDSRIVNRAAVVNSWLDVDSVDLFKDFRIQVGKILSHLVDQGIPGSWSYRELA